MTEKSIQKALLYFFNSHIYKFTNAFFFSNESDWLSFLPSGFCYEVEIKISRSDFKADFKKEKHSIHNGNKIKSGLYLKREKQVINYRPSWEMCKLFPELLVSKERVHRYDETNEISFYMHISSGIDILSSDNTMIPNKFFYCVPTGLVSKEEVPDYAGLLYVDHLGRITKVKDGKFLHKDRLDVKRLFSKTYYVYEKQLHEKLKK